MGKGQEKEEGTEKEEVGGVGKGGGRKKKLTIEGQCVWEKIKIMNLEPHPKVELGFIPSKKP
jgi:hypothetical protein